jgi:hypothetical protein
MTLHGDDEHGFDCAKRGERMPLRGDPADENSVTIDVYGIKTRVRPVAATSAPLSWSEVRDQVRRDLLRLAVAPTRFVAELFEGATRLVRGISLLPAATAARIQSAHIEADLAEDMRQRATLGRPPTTESDVDAEGGAETIVNRLEVLLKRIREHGRDGVVILMRDGSILVVLGTPEDARDLVEATAEEVVSMFSSSDSPPVLEAGLSSLRQE